MLPVLMLLFMGILYFGRFLNYASQATRMASEAARWAAVNTNPGTSPQTIQTYVAAQATGEFGGSPSSTDVPAAAKVYLYSTSTTPQIGDPVRACVTATVHFLPIFGLADTQLVETATMRLEQVPTNWTHDTPPSACPALP